MRTLLRLTISWLLCVHLTFLVLSTSDRWEIGGNPELSLPGRHLLIPKRQPKFSVPAVQTAGENRRSTRYQQVSRFTAQAGITSVQSLVAASVQWPRGLSAIPTITCNTLNLKGQDITEIRRGMFPKELSTLAALDLRSFMIRVGVKVEQRVIPVTELRLAYLTVHPFGLTILLHCTTLNTYIPA